MPPKKREKDSESVKTAKHDHLHADHELFLQAFEKPTQIYRFLRTRNILSPIFLNRTLSYMKRRMSRSNKSRLGFKVDSLLEQMALKRGNELQPNCLGGFMTLTFLGFYDKSVENPRDYQIKVETYLLKICHKKRKESSSAIIEVSVGSCSVPLNPSSSEPPAMASAVSITSDTFSPSQGPNVKSYMLMLRVTMIPAHGTHGANSEITNGDCPEPAPKRLKSSSVEQHFQSSDFKAGTKDYGSELIVYDKHNRCLLTAGEYDLVMHDAPKQETSSIKSPHKALMAQWETIPDETEVPTGTNPFDIFKLRPILKLKLSWSQENTNGLVQRPRPQLDHTAQHKDPRAGPGAANKENNRPLGQPITNTLRNDTSSNESRNGGGSNVTSDKKSPGVSGQQIVYQFLYNNNSRQQTEACDDLHCPWCSLDCGTLYSLLKHLKMCHSRFTFTYFPIPGGARIDVSINDLYDGSYTGSPHDLIAAQGRQNRPSTPSGTPGPRAGPARRTTSTHILVCRKQRHTRVAKQSLAEFLEAEDECAESQRPYVTGHDRLYHHTITCLPVYPKELDIDSEGESDPLWLQQKTMMMIDEFTDVNEGEKELMKMWNLHVMKHNFVGDCQIAVACKLFLQTRGKELLQKKLYRNFVLHMCSLHDFGLINPVALYHTLQMLNQLLAESVEAKEAMRESIRLQRYHWTTVGRHQQPTVIEQKAQQTQNKQAGFNTDASPAVRRKTSNLQNANRMASSSYNIQLSNSGEPKRKMSSSQLGEISPPRRKSVQLSNHNKNKETSPLRRRSTNAVPPQSRKRSSTTSTTAPAVTLEQKGST